MALQACSTAAGRTCSILIPPFVTMAILRDSVVLESCDVLDLSDIHLSRCVEGISPLYTRLWPTGDPSISSKLAQVDKAEKPSERRKMLKVACAYVSCSCDSYCNILYCRMGLLMMMVKTCNIRIYIRYFLMPLSLIRKCSLVYQHALSVAGRRPVAL